MPKANSLALGPISKNLLKALNFNVTLGDKGCHPASIGLWTMDARTVFGHVSSDDVEKRMEHGSSFILIRYWSQINETVK